MQLQLSKSRLIRRLAVVILFITAFSAVSHAGGYAFEIYLNNKLLLKQQHTKVISGSPLLQFTAANANDNLRIMFTNCGMTRKTRSIALKDESNTIVKSWEFAYATGDDFTMTIPVKEILAVQKSKGNGVLKVYYFSPDQFSNGQMIASVQSDGKRVAYQSAKNRSTWAGLTAGLFALGALGWIVRKKVA